MMKKRGIFVAVAVAGLVCSGAGAANAGATPIVNGTVSCTTSGTASFKPGLPLTDSGVPLTKAFKTGIKFAGALSSCTGTGDAAAIASGSIKGKAKYVSSVGSLSPSCLGLTSLGGCSGTCDDKGICSVPGENCSPVIKATAKLANSVPKNIGKATALLTLGSATTGPPISFIATGAIIKGALMGGTMSAHVILDDSFAALAGKCAVPDGLTSILFTGVSGSSVTSAHNP